MIRKRAERLGKRALVWVLKRCVKSEPGPKINPGKVKKILVVRQDDRIGNLVLITPMLEALRRGFPGRRIVLLVGQSFHEILQGNPHCDEVVVFEKRRYIFHPFDFFRLVKRLRAERFDLALDCSHVHAFSFSNGLLTYLSGAPYRVGYGRGNSDLFLNMSVCPQPSGKHATEAHMDLVRSLGVEVDNPQMRVYMSENERESIRWYLRQKGVSEEDLLCGLHIGGSGKKRWPVENFARLADELNRLFGMKVIILWGQKEASLLPDLERHLRTTPIVSDPLRIREMTALIEQCSLFVAPDTGPMHISVAVGTPTVAIFLAPNYPVYGPRGDGHKVVYREGGQVTVDDVVAAVRTLEVSKRNSTQCVA